MQLKMFKVLGAMAVGLSAMLTAPASAQLSTTANGPYYATPSWDQKLTTNRFVILANWDSEAVLDRETGLVWERAPDTENTTLQNAMFRCFNLTTGNRAGWRVPQVHELLSLIDPSAQSNPSLPTGHPFNFGTLTGSDFNGVGFWAATTPLSLPEIAFTVSFRVITGPTSQGRAPGRQKDSPNGRTWCVRGGIGALQVY